MVRCPNCEAAGRGIVQLEVIKEYALKDANGIERKYVDLICPNYGISCNYFEKRKQWKDYVDDESEEKRKQYSEQSSQRRREQVKKTVHERLEEAKQRKEARKKSKEEAEERRKKREEERIKARGEQVEKKWYRRTSKSITEHGENIIFKFLPILIFSVLGIVVSLFFNSWLFLMAFLCLSIYYILPEPPPKMEGKIILKWSEFKLWKRDAKYFKNSNAGFGFLRTLFKVSTLIFFIIALKSGTVPFLNIALIIVAFLGYYWLNVTYDPDTPSEVIESVFRFGIGIFVIPWWIFYSIFDSAVLGIIAMAFFAIPPIPKKEKASQAEIFAFYDMIDKFLFLGLMIFALLGSGILGSSILGIPTWELTGPLKSMFIYFWLVTGIAGFFSPAETRPTTGFLMLGAATVIFALGPGTQEVGQALLGPWFPTVYTTVSDVFKPITDVFGALSQTIGQSVYLIFNPVGFAHQIMNGSYTKDSTTGLTGAFGVEIESFRTTPIYLGQPYSVIMKIKNKGAYEAERVRILLEAGKKTAKEEKIMPLGKDTLSITELGIISDTDFGVKCIYSSEPYCFQFIDNEQDNKLAKLDVRQLFFHTNDVGITCPIVNKYELRDKFIPIKGTLRYDYKISSTLEAQFMSADEWTRRAEQGLLLTQNKKISTFTNAPVKLNVDTAEQPIREGTPFHIGINLVSAKGRDSEISNVNIELYYPVDMFKIRGKCTKGPTNPVSEQKDGILVWKNIQDPMLIYCYFEALKSDDFANSSIKTFLIRANASYTFTERQTIDSKIEFGGIVCCEKDKDCPPGMKCNLKTQICGDLGKYTAEDCIPGASDYCECMYEKSGDPGGRYPRCGPHAGGCTDIEQCEPGLNLECKSIDEIKACCIKGEKEEECKNLFNQWLTSV